MPQRFDNETERRGRLTPARIVDKRRKQVFDAFFNVVKSDETYAREVYRFWFEQAYTDLKKQVRSKKSRPPAARGP